MLFLFVFLLYLPNLILDGLYGYPIHQVHRSSLPVPEKNDLSMPQQDT